MHCERFQQALQLIRSIFKVKKFSVRRYPNSSPESKGGLPPGCFDVATWNRRIPSQASRPVSSRRTASAFSASLSGRLAIICIAAAKSLSRGGSEIESASFSDCLADAKADASAATG